TLGEFERTDHSFFLQEANTTAARLEVATFEDNVIYPTAEATVRKDTIWLTASLQAGHYGLSVEHYTLQADEA
ncbi:hypothetical protein ACI1VO_27695, partial [Escherichia coli]